MSEEKTVYDFLMEARAEVAGRLDGTFQPREVEYEWRVPAYNSQTMNERHARSAARELREQGENNVVIERRPVGEWERVEG
jgi:hypothetical protein